MYCHVRCAWEREMWCNVLSHAVRVITISQDLILHTHSIQAESCIAKHPSSSPDTKGIFSLNLTLIT